MSLSTRERRTQWALCQAADTLREVEVAYLAARHKAQNRSVSYYLLFHFLHIIRLAIHFSNLLRFVSHEAEWSSMKNVTNMCQKTEFVNTSLIKGRRRKAIGISVGAIYHLPDYYECRLFFA